MGRLFRDRLLEVSSVPDAQIGMGGLFSSRIRRADARTRHRARARANAYHFQARRRGFSAGLRTSDRYSVRCRQDDLSPARRTAWRPDGRVENEMSLEAAGAEP